MSKAKGQDSSTVPRELLPFLDALAEILADQYMKVDLDLEDHKRGFIQRPAVESWDQWKHFRTAT